MKLYILKDSKGKVFSRFDPMLKPVFVKLDKKGAVVYLTPSKKEIEDTKKDLEAKFSIPTEIVTLEMK